MDRKYKTPGVYIEEKQAFSKSIVALPTSVPAFIGYTEKAIKGNNLSLLNQPTRIESFAEFEQYFGGPPETKIALENDPTGVAPYVLKMEEASRFFLHSSMKLFYLNGGGPCYIVSIGGYKDGAAPTKKTTTAFKAGIEKLLKFLEPTMVVIPDAVLLEENTDCYAVQNAMIKHCGVDMRNRVAILDIFDGYRTEDKAGNAVNAIQNFRKGMVSPALDFAAAYYPWLETNVTPSNEVSSSNISTKDKLIQLLKADFPVEGVDAKTKERNTKIQVQIGQLSSAKGADLRLVDQTLLAVSPLFKTIFSDFRAALNLLPPSGAIAGVISFVDQSMGVSRAPANITLRGVIKPCISISNAEQEDLNAPLHGKAINAIRLFPGKGVLVWGARTMDANSPDWRYLSVRRATIMIEQSIKIALGAYVFEPNNQNTWTEVKMSITNFLTSQWANGTLVGPTPEDAFSVKVGLGITMTPVDILEGFMIVNVMLALARPAEFIVLTFTEKMASN